MQISPDIKARFFAKVEIPDDPEACWRWLAAKNRQGYGLMHVKGGLRPAPRISYAIHALEPPLADKMFVCHSCDNPECTNPLHLWLGSPGENTRDMLLKNRAKNKLCENDVRRIRREGTSPEAVRRLAHEYGVSYNHVSSIFRRRYWADVAD